MNSQCFQPDKDLLFEPVVDAHGLRLALVFGNENDGGVCPFYEKQCVHCEIGAGEGSGYDFARNMQRLSFFKEYYQDQMARVVHVVVYNSGSVLNPKEMSRETIAGILVYASTLSQCRVVSLDTRELFVTESSLEFAIVHLSNHQQARVILGIESQDDSIRIDKLKKKMHRRDIEKAFQSVSQHSRRVAITASIVFQPPELLGTEAVEEGLETAKYCMNLTEKYGVSLDINIHPYYPSRKSVRTYPDHPRANLGDVVQCVSAIKQLSDDRSMNVNVFVGLNDEGHDQEQDKKTLERESYSERFNRFNASQSLADLTQ